MQSVTDWNTKQTAYTYDNAGRLAAVACTSGGTSLETIGYTRDAVGDPTQLVDSTGTTTDGYDALDRLTSASYPNGDAVSYAYDAVGNRTGLTVNGSTTTSTFDAADRLTQSGTTTYTYDASGDELTKTAGGVTTTNAYDPLNRLTGITGPTTATYSYNGDGLRVAKTVNSVTTSYTWDPTGLGTVLSDGTGQYLWGQGLVGAVTGAATSYVQSDGLGSVRLVTGAAGATLGSASYDAYGSSRSTSGTLPPFGFTGEQTDAESGLVYLRSRYYDPTSGRFLTKDPLGLAGGGTNLYAYVQDRPTSKVDPSGLEAACTTYQDDGTCADDDTTADQPPSDAGNALVLVAGAWWVGSKVGQASAAGLNKLGQAVAQLCPFGGSEATTPSGPNGPSATLTPSAGSSNHVAPSTSESWGNPNTLPDHFLRHGGDFGAQTADEYARLDSEFLQRSQRERLPT